MVCQTAKEFGLAIVQAQPEVVIRIQVRVIAAYVIRHHNRRCLLQAGLAKEELLDAT